MSSNKVGLFMLLTLGFIQITEIIARSEVSIISNMDTSSLIQDENKVTYKTSSGYYGICNSENVSKEAIESDAVNKKSERLFKIYAESDKDFLDQVGCFTNDVVREVGFKTSQQKSLFHPIIRVYLEVDYQAFIDNNSNLNATIDWVLFMFDQTKDIYAISNIDLIISEIFIWDTPDIYLLESNPGMLLDRFAEHMQDGFNGDVAQLCSTRSLGGGKAFINSICLENNSQNNSGPYSVITNLSIDQTPNVQYDWSIYSMSHELGHVLGSPHTHACLWGLESDKALDNCFVPEGNCASASSSSLPGGIMSYCYLQDRGISFDIGLDEEPGALVFNNLMSKSCVAKSCMNLPCDDNNECTTDDQYDVNCNCTGILIDINSNGLCDLGEQCVEQINLLNISPDSSAYMASQSIILSTTISQEIGSLALSAGLEIQFIPGISIDSGVELTVFASGCNQN